MLVKIANTEDPYQTASLEKSELGLGLCCLSASFGRELVFEILGHLLYVSS